MANATLTRRIANFGSLDIAISDKNMIFGGSGVSKFCRDRKIDLHAIIHGHRQSLGDTKRRNRYFKDIKHQIIDGGKVESKDWADMHLCV